MYDDKHLCILTSHSSLKAFLESIASICATKSSDLEDFGTADFLAPEIPTKEAFCGEQV